MGPSEALLIAGSLLAVAAFWAAPAWLGQNLVAAITAGTLLLVAPVAAVWLVGSVALTPPVMHLGERLGRRGSIAAGWTVVLVALLLASRQFESWGGSAIALVGGAYFTLRHIHVLIEWWLGRLKIPTFGAYARYHLFLPVLMAGPIHRLPHFERQSARRRWDREEFFSGAERALFGLFLATAIGNLVFDQLDSALAPRLVTLNAFLREWMLSAIDWVRLYVQFAGLTDLALGLSLMMGLRLEENFNQPWRARDLIDFWNRWHMTLSHWCRDYVYVPIAARFRAPLAGVIAAMLVLGLWHKTSVYYVVWALWQALGIVIARVYRNVRGRANSEGGRDNWLRSILVPVGILAWVSAARPVIMLALGGLQP